MRKIKLFLKTKNREINLGFFFALNILFVSFIEVYLQISQDLHPF